jgi:hypothetical protein
VVPSLAGAANEILRAVSDALSDDLRPVCKAYQTHGIPVIFQCCDCGDPDEPNEEANGEISIHFRRLMDADPSSLDEVRRIRPCHGGTTAAQFRLVLARCRPIINEKGEIPSPQTLTDHTQDQLRDVELLWQGIACSGLDVRIDDVSADLSDPGNCSVTFADLTVQVLIPALPVDDSS